MRERTEAGFSLVELMVAIGLLLAVLSAILWFFSKGQTVYSDERATLDMAQDLRTAFDRFTDEVRMAGAGLPGYHGVVSGSVATLIVRGDFNNTTTTITSLGANTGGIFSVGTTSGFAVGQTVSLLNSVSGACALAKITAVGSIANTIAVDSSDLLPITSGASISDFGGGTIISVIERRTYKVITAQNDPRYGAITRTTAYEDTQSAGSTISAEEVIARNVLTTSGAVGLAFTYLDAIDAPIAFDPASGLIDSTRVAKVQIDLQARTQGQDLESGKYRTLKLTALIQVRGQYIPAVGF